MATGMGNGRWGCPVTLSLLNATMALQQELGSLLKAVASDADLSLLVVESKNALELKQHFEFQLDALYFEQPSHCLQAGQPSRKELQALLENQALTLLADLMEPAITAVPDISDHNRRRFVVSYLLAQAIDASQTAVTLHMLPEGGMERVVATTWNIRVVHLELSRISDFGWLALPANCVVRIYHESNELPTETLDFGLSLGHLQHLRLRLSESMSVQAAQVIIDALGRCRSTFPLLSLSRDDAPLKWETLLDLDPVASRLDWISYPIQARMAAPSQVTLGLAGEDVEPANDQIGTLLTYGNVHFSLNRVISAELREERLIDLSARLVLSSWGATSLTLQQTHPRTILIELYGSLQLIESLKLKSSQLFPRLQYAFLHVGQGEQLWLPFPRVLPTLADYPYLLADTPKDRRDNTLPRRRQVPSTYKALPSLMWLAVSLQHLGVRVADLVWQQLLQAAMDCDVLPMVDQLV